MRSLTDYLLLQKELRSEKTAVSDEHSSLTFSELNKTARRISAALSDRTGGVTGAPVIVFAEKNVTCYAALMGILYSGNCYAPLDTKMPTERLMKILRKLGAKAAVTTRALAEKLLSSGFDGELLFTDEISHLSHEAEPVKADADSPAYILFTSGSTGEPKGVVVSRRAVDHHMLWQTKHLPIGENAVLGNQAPFYFDASMPDIFTPLFTGAELHIIPERLFLLPHKLTEHINDNGINTLIWVPSAMMLLSSQKVFEDAPIKGLRTVVFCGEVLPTVHFNRWRGLCPDTVFVNMYGPTEAAYGCTYHIAERCYAETEALPIGIPCEGTRILLLDESGQPSDSGEVCVIGERLADGYLCDIAATERSFTLSHDGERMYRTGDLARYNDHGELIYLGRLDRQIKRQGYRIELGEIEAAAYGCGALNCRCIYQRDSGTLVLFCVTDSAVSEKELYCSLKERLPSYMLPSEIILTNEMPLNANGKTDEKRLFEIAAER